MGRGCCTRALALVSYAPAFLRAKDRMDAASHGKRPVRRLARVSGVSPAHFARSFKEAFGVPPHQYLLTRRIERVTAALRDTRHGDHGDRPGVLAGPLSSRSLAGTSFRRNASRGAMPRRPGYARSTSPAKRRRR
jgi:AraC-like DNA-binding protein